MRRTVASCGKCGKESSFKYKNHKIKFTIRSFFFCSLRFRSRGLDAEARVVSFSHVCRAVGRRRGVVFCGARESVPRICDCRLRSEVQILSVISEITTGSRGSPADRDARRRLQHRAQPLHSQLLFFWLPAILMHANNRECEKFIFKIHFYIHFYIYIPIGRLPA